MKPWKLIIFLIILAFVVFFAGFNINNISSISFGFFKLEEVPIFLSLFIAFLLGAFVMLPFTFRRGKRGDKKKSNQFEDGTDQKKQPEIREETEETPKDS